MIVSPFPLSEGSNFCLFIQVSFSKMEALAANPAPIKEDALPQGELDLYAGVDEFGNPANANEGPEAAYGTDLYEDVLTIPEVPKESETFTEEALPSGKEYKSYTTVHPKSALQQEKEAKIAASLYSKGADKGKALYVGNLPWWTTDEELSNAIQGCGVTDLINIKFFENRANGQSKGFAVVEVGSETSQRLIMERLDKQELHGQKPAVTHVSKQNLMMFENQAKKNRPGEAGQEQSVPHTGFQPRANNFGSGMRFPARFPQVPRMPPMIRPGMPGNIPQPFGGMPNAFNPRAPHLGMPPMDNRGQPMRPPGAFVPGMVPGMMPMGMQGAPGMPPVHASTDHMMGGVPVSMQHVVGSAAIPGSTAERPDLNGLQQMPKPGIAPHVNPAFLPQDGTHADPFSAGVGNPLALRMSAPMGGPIQDGDLDSMRRNQAVASTAIQRAMADANEGDYESGIETLVTAISLIKQSSTANTESSQVLVQSLQDCLHSLEAQLMTRGKTDRDRDDRTRSPLDDYRSERRHKSRRHRSRSRSRSRDRRRSYSPRGDRSRSRERRRR